MSTRVHIEAGNNSRPYKFRVFPGSDKSVYADVTFYADTEWKAIEKLHLDCGDDVHFLTSAAINNVRYEQEHKAA